MATLFDSASLAMIPSGYKDDKLYSIKPTDGSGDFTFSRDGAGASPATRVNASGLIEKGRENEILQSNTFDTTWVTTSASVTSGQSGYDGSNDAWLLQATSTSARVTQNNTTSGVQTFSVYAKAGTADYLAFYNIISGLSPRAWFNLSNGTIENSLNNIDANIESVGGGWHRCSLTYDAILSDARIYVAREAGNFNTISGDNIYIQDAQLEQGLISTSYIATTTAPVSAGLLGDMPRLDYSGGATCPSLLLEPSRVNILPYSEYFGAWTTQAGITLTPNTDETTSPEGLNNAYKIVSTNASNGFYYAGLNSTAASIRSIYLKGASGGETLELKDPSGYGTSTSVTLTTEWQRFTHSTSNTGQNYQGLWIDNISVGTIYAYGAQMEEASYPTSYIPTYGSASTRGDDDCSKTGISSLIGQTEGTLFLEAKVTIGGRLMLIGTGGNFIEVLINAAGKVNGFVRTSVTEADILSTATYATGDTLKVAFAYNTNDFALYVNGSAQGTDTSGNVPTGMAQLIMNDYLSTGFNSANAYKQALLFKTRLTNAELAALTTI